MAKTLGQAVNAGLKEIGEGEITAFTSTNILHQLAIEEVNERVNMILARVRSAYRWTYARTTLTTTNDITTGTVIVTNGSTTVTSSGNNFTNAAAGMFIRVGSDNTSYEIASVDTAASPDTLTLSTAYVGSDATTATYVILKDIYSISTSNYDELKIATYGDSGSWASGLQGRLNTDQMGIVDIHTIYQEALGDLHRDTGGKPRLLCRISPDSSDNPRVLLWPYPKSQMLIDLWYAQKFGVLSTFSTNLFGGDAPDLAYDAVFHGVRARCTGWDKDKQAQGFWEAKFEDTLKELIAREHRQSDAGNTMQVETFRRFSRRGLRVESQNYFDTMPYAHR